MLREAEPWKTWCDDMEARVLGRGRGQQGEDLLNLKEVSWP
jgi:hypothetical protein